MSHRNSFRTVLLSVCFFLVPIFLSDASRGDFPDRSDPQKHLAFRPVPFTSVHFKDSFWTPRFETNRKVSIPHAFQWCEDTGRFTNFAKAAGLMEGKFEGIFFNDSDVYKLIEGREASVKDFFRKGAKIARV